MQFFDKRQNINILSNVWAFPAVSKAWTGSSLEFVANDLKAAESIISKNLTWVFVPDLSGFDFEVLDSFPVRFFVPFHIFRGMDCRGYLNTRSEAELSCLQLLVRQTYRRGWRGRKKDGDDVETVVSRNTFLAFVPVPSDC